MAQVLIRNLESTVVERLRARARANGRSLEAELRLILRREVGAAVGEERARSVFKPNPSPSIKPPKKEGPLPPFKPIKVRGKPVSQTLIEDRR